MEKAVLKTLIYYDYFDFPLKAWEIHKWLIGKEVSLSAVEKTLTRLEKKGKIGKKNGFYFLRNGQKLVNLRKKREAVSGKHNKQAFIIGNLFKVIPWVSLVGISGSLAMMGSQEKDDIDLFIITEKNRIWLSRLALIFISSVTGLRRRRREKLLKARGKICINLILENDNLALNKRNVYVAHEVLQMRPIWQRGEIYSKFLHDNVWAFKYLPNWKTGVKSQISNLKSQNYTSKLKTFKLIDIFEEMAKNFQLKIMNSPTGAERIENGALYFHPEDKGIKVLEKYEKGIKKLVR